MKNNKLEMAPEKTQAVLFSGRSTVNSKKRDNNIEMKNAVNYLEVILDKEL